jgi:hypothetical protein
LEQEIDAQLIELTHDAFLVDLITGSRPRTISAPGHRRFRMRVD